MDVGGIPVETKAYEINELDALKKKYSKINEPLGLSAEASDGSSISVKMKTSVFEVLRANLLDELEKNRTIDEVEQERVAQAATTSGHKADMEYHVGVEFTVEGNTHKVFIKCFTTTSSIQIQGRGEHKQRDCFGNQYAPKFFAEQYILPFAKASFDRGT